MLSNQSRYVNKKNQHPPYIYYNDAKKQPARKQDSTTGR